MSHAIHQLKYGKAADIDNLHPEHLKYGGFTLTQWFTKIVNHLTSLEDVPMCLKECLVTHIYKKQGKDPFLVSSYRGITISSIFARVLEIIILLHDYQMSYLI